MKKVAVINDLSGFGKCSLTVALPIISALGLECCPVPTAVLSNQTGYDEFYSVDFTDHLPSYINVWKKQNIKFDAILIGYLASEKQVEIILDFIEDFKNDDTIVVVDPIMADDGVMYHTYNDELCDEVKKLTQKADIITPNLTELCILCGADYEEINREKSVEKIGKLASSLLSETTKIVIVTGTKKGNEVYNIIATKNAIDVIKSTLLQGAFSGTGDIFSSIVCGEIVNKKSVKDAVLLATEFITESIKSTPTKLSYEPNGVNFQKHLEMLIYAK